MSTKKRKFLTLEQRIAAIKMLESGQSSRRVAEQFGVGRTQIQDTLKRKAEYMSDFEQNLDPERKREKSSVSSNEQLNDLMVQWINDANSRSISLSGPLIQQKALKFATKLGLSEFKASNGWLEKFLKRNNLVCKKMSGERGDVDSKTVNDWKEKLPTLCVGYEPRDIFNMDETGIFFKAGRKTTFIKSGQECAGGKRAKNRITVALCASMCGEKLKPLIIGKAEKPRCFSKVKTESLPVTYRANKKSWMNSKLFEEWVRSVDRKMRHQGRKILLFVDNAPSHPHISLKNVKLIFLPPNTTSVVQPMDQGIIQAVKLLFYRYQSEQIIVKMDGSSKCGSELLKEVSVLDAIYWVARAWRELNTSTIVKCFSKCGFEKLQEGETSDSEGGEDCDDDIPLAVLARSREIYDCDIKDVIEHEELPTCETAINWDLPATELIRSDSVDSGSEIDGGSTENTDSPLSCSLTEVNEYIARLKTYACQKGHTKFLNCVMELSAVASEIQLEAKFKQTSIRDFFVKK